MALGVKDTARVENNREDIVKHINALRILLGSLNKANDALSVFSNETKIGSELVSGAKNTCKQFEEFIKVLETFNSQLKSFIDIQMDVNNGILDRVAFGGYDLNDVK